MTLGERIEGRLSDLGMTQAELARRAKVPQTTINSLIRAPSRRSSPHLLKIARALHTTPAFLTGEVDDPTADAPESPALTDDQSELLGFFDRLSRADQQALLQIARSMGGGEPDPPRRLHADATASKGE
ncbi:helix-turn-helix domain-containing protein [Sphingomonas sp. MG17]|uniref:Helix-turn-helix domain-containing protein n=1 Tax=Sphingomonas tagetis TaxID=2949092 RepID=A0A9X2KKE8_9SPHN|nr:helix-turn-helix domain-containing protein [Sphingomonas tagetis]MCP3729281.1 helix-turn-helix domain-containing protein [Sphingomonas tagetis]